MTTKLLPGEHPRCLARPHWIVLARSLVWVPIPLGAAGVLTVTLHALAPLRGLADLAPPAFLLSLVISSWVAGAAFLSWSSQFVLVTDLRAIQQSGIMRRRRTMIPLDRIQDVTTERGLLGALLDYGNIIVTTAGLPVGATSSKTAKRGGDGMVARPSLILQRVRAPEQVAQCLFDTGTSGMLDDHDGSPKIAGAARFHGRRQVDGGPAGRGAGPRGVRRPGPAHRA